MIPITLANQGELVTVKKITGSDAIRQHLAELGFVVDAEVKVVSAFNGNVILQVHGAKIALNETMARRIMVKHGYRWIILQQIKDFIFKEENNMATQMGTLNNVRVGKTATIKKINGAGAVKRRIMDMGLTKGTDVFVRKVAPLGDPIELTIRGYELSVRKADAALIDVEIED